MSTLTISIPDSLRRSVELLAEADGVAVDNFVSTVLAQRIAIAEADSYVRRRGSRGSAAQLLDILRSAPQVEPDAKDRLPHRTLAEPQR